jgi:hypothetical protein
LIRRDAALQSAAQWHIACILIRQALCHDDLVVSAVAQGRKEMPYLIGWLLGVPLIVLVILYLIFH